MKKATDKAQTNYSFFLTYPGMPPPAVDVYMICGSTGLLDKYKNQYFLIRSKDLDYLCTINGKTENFLKTLFEDRNSDGRLLLMKLLDDGILSSQQIELYRLLLQTEILNKKIAASKGEQYPLRLLSPVKKKSPETKPKTSIESVPFKKRFSVTTSIVGNFTFHDVATMETDKISAKTIVFPPISKFQNHGLGKKRKF